MRTTLALMLVMGMLVGCGRPAAERPQAAAGGSTPQEAAAAGAAPAPQVVTTKTGVEMVFIPGGSFRMGDEQGGDDEKPVREVRVSPFYMDCTEVTQAAYQAIMGKNPSQAVGPERPVERVSWVSAAQYCNERSRREGLKPCYEPGTLSCDDAADGYRLPTEAEWEYACRAGTTGRWSCGDDAAQLAQHAWFKNNSEKTTHPVRQRQPNPWGLYDMHGNVAEWCQDYYAESYDPAETVDPRGPSAGEERVLRGGSFKTTADGCRSAARFSETPAFADACFGTEAYGFRCVRRADQTRSSASSSEGAKP